MHRVLPLTALLNSLAANSAHATMRPWFNGVALAMTAIVPSLTAQEPSAASVDSARIAFPKSLVPLPPGARVQMAADTEPVNFQVALRMTEGAYPPKADYLALADWLKAQGFTLSGVDPDHRMSIEVSGTVAQACAALRSRFGRVNVGDNSYVTALNDAPSLPASVGSCVLGINGLQPFLHLNKGPRAVSPVAGKPVVR